MRRGRLGVFAIFLVVAGILACSPLAGASAAFDDGGWLGESSLHVALVGQPLPAVGAPLQLSVRTDAPGALEARLTPPDGAADGWFPLSPRDGAHTAPLVFSHEGPWTLEVRSTATDATARFVVDVWPEAGAFLEPASDAAKREVVVAGERAEVALRLFDEHGRLVPPPADARAEILRPSGATETLPLARSGDTLVLASSWNDTGLYRIEVLSDDANLRPGARPPLVMMSVPASEADVYGLDEARDVPGAGAVVAVAGAVLAVALAGSRRPRA